MEGIAGRRGRCVGGYVRTICHCHKEQVVGSCWLVWHYVRMFGLSLIGRCSVVAMSSYACTASDVVLH